MRIVPFTAALALLLLSRLGPVCAADFDFSAYRPTSVPEITNKWNAVTKGYTPGFSVKPPEKVAVTAVAFGAPFACNIGVLRLVLNQLNLSHVLQQAPVSHCIKLSLNESSDTFNAYVQDVLTASYAAEVKDGAKVKVYAGFLAYVVRTNPEKNFPMLLVSEFEAQP